MLSGRVKQFPLVMAENKLIMRKGAQLPGDMDTLFLRDQVIGIRDQGSGDRYQRTGIREQ